MTRFLCIFLLSWYTQNVIAQTDSVVASADTLLKYERVIAAEKSSGAFWKEECRKLNLQFPPKQIYIRVFKKEQLFEIWAADTGRMHLLKTFPVCMIPGKLGPKLKQGDKQVPEGLYEIDVFNPQSDFHLSMRINYPNIADWVRSLQEPDPGGDIYIHGDCYSVGCLPMTDEGITAIFWLCAARQMMYPDKNIPVHIFPFKMDSDIETHTYSEATRALWQQLRPFYLYFEQNRVLPTFDISQEGAYILID